MKNSFCFIFLLISALILFSCVDDSEYIPPISSEEQRLMDLEERRAAYRKDTIAPIQSDSVLLGEKIMGYRDSIVSDSIIYKIPIWRKDNFNFKDSIHKSEINALYSNYNIDFLNINTAIIYSKKIYYDARIFVRVIVFDENGYQTNDTTFYNKRMGETYESSEIIFLSLEDPIGSTNAYTINNETGYTATTVLFDRDWNFLKAVREPKWGLGTNYPGISEDNGRIILKFTVVETCGECNHDWWGYKVILNLDGTYNSSEITSYDTTNFYIPNIEEFQNKQKEIWQ